MAYFSNSSEGAYLEAQCAECPLGDGPCPIYGAQMVFNYEQIGNDLATKIMNNYVSEEGVCQMRSLVVEAVEK